MPAADWNPDDHHRGPFSLQICRPRTVAAGSLQYPATFERLRGLASSEDVEAEALALLADPRDSIVAVYVWSETEQQHVMTYRKGARRA